MATATGTTATRGCAPSLVLDALVGTGHAEIARGFSEFLMRSAAGNAADLQIMYGAYGERRLPEVEPTSPGTGTRGRCGSATRQRRRCSWTCTAT